MRLVSNFELVTKPVIPAQIPTVLQGYFLSISNLENKEFRFGLEFQLSGNASQTNRWISNATVKGVVDIAGNNTPLSFSPGPFFGNVNAAEIVKTDQFTIPARQTALVVIQPNFNPAIPGNFEARGHVRLVLPGNNAFIQFNPFQLVPASKQSPGPVKVLLQAESRNAIFGGPGLDTSATTYSLASGAETTVAPNDGNGLFFIPSPGPVATSGLTLGSSFAEVMQAMATNAEGVKMLNEALAAEGMKAKISLK
jgi:hypothetical protein